MPAAICFQWVKIDAQLCIVIKITIHPKGMATKAFGLDLQQKIIFY
jgi:hypothetical protein